MFAFRQLTIESRLEAGIVLRYRRPSDV